MRLRIPSIRFQIIFLVIFLIFLSVLFFRNYFIESFQDFSESSESLSLNESTLQLYEKYESQIDENAKEDFRRDVEEIMSTENQEAIARLVFINEVQLYSKFILTFLILFVLILSAISFYFITRPIKRLQRATNELAAGNLEARVKESPLSPLNDLILSFNNMAEELLTNRRKLIQAEKDAAWRDMARVLAHEIKNPLTPMRLSLERLETKFAMKSDNLDEIFSKVTKVIHEEIDKLQNFASEFSNFAKLPSAVMEHYNINDQIVEVCSQYENAVNIKLNLENELQDILADKVQMKQVLDNLIQNSINASEDKATIDINSFIEDGNINVSIRDYGKGIEKEHLREIFKPYFTKSKGGTGLGLAIVRRIVKNHGGNIDVESSIGKGTKLTLSFPLENSLEK